VTSYPSFVDGSDDRSDETGKSVKDVASDGECDSNSVCKLLMCFALKWAM